MSQKKKRRRVKPIRSKPTTDKYKTDKYVEYILTAEISLFNAATLLPDLTDGEVVAALRNLIGQIRKTNGLPRYQEQPADPEGLVAWLVVQNWTHLFDQRRKLSRNEMAGCLEVVIESAETRMRKPDQRKYLNYLKKFLKRAGLSVETIPLSELEADEPDDDMFYDPKKMSLAQLGALWLQKPDAIGIEDAFENEANSQIVNGRAEEVIELCRTLLDQTSDLYIEAILYTVQGQAYRHLGQIEQAMTALTTATSYGAGYLAPWHELAEIYYEQEQYEQAIQAWRKCLGGDRYDTYTYHQIARAYRQMKDLAGEEAAWRDLLKIQQWRGCLGFWAKLLRRHRSVATLVQLGDCLYRQGKTDEVDKVLALLARSWPHPADPFEDWAYWVRYRLEQKKMVESMLTLLRGSRLHLSQPIWSDLLQACIYDWLEQPGQSAPLWEKVNRQLIGTPRDWALTKTVDILGEILPTSSQLFALAQEVQKSNARCRSRGT